MHFGKIVLSTLLLLVLLTPPANAGIFTDFMVSAAASSMVAGSSSIAADDYTKMSDYLARRHEKKNYGAAGKYYATLCEKGPYENHRYNAAIYYFNTGQKDKAIELLEEKVLPTGLVQRRSEVYQEGYKKMAGLSQNAKIDWDRIFANKMKQEEKVAKVVKESTSPANLAKTIDKSSSSSNLVFWLILLVLTLNLFVTIKGKKALQYENLKETFLAAKSKLDRTNKQD